MPKKLLQIVKLQIPSGKANPALGQHGLNIQDFCKQFNDRSKDQPNTILPVAINVYDDRSFDFIIKTPPASELIKKAINLESGSKMSHKDKVGKITKAQIREIAEKKMPDLNANDVDAAMKIIAGTARSMGVVVVD